MNNIVIMGPPGVGKGTQAAFLAEELDIPHVTTGQMLRDEIARGTEIGRTLSHVVDAGEFVSDALTSELLRMRLRTLRSGFILDGYPRTPGQVHTLDAILTARQESIDVVLLLQADDDVLTSRIAQRSDDTRTDDREEIVRHRLALYRATTSRIAAGYEDRGLLHRVDASGTRDDVRAALRAALTPPVATL